MAPKLVSAFVLLLVAACHPTPVPNVAGAPPLPEESPAPLVPEPEPEPEPVTGDPCTSDADCGTHGVCQSILIAACPTCDGGRVVQQCKVLPEGCPVHINCMPRTWQSPDAPACPPPWIAEHCPSTQVTY